MKVPLFYQRNVRVNTPMGPLKNHPVFLWVRDEPPSPTLVDQGWLQVYLDNKHIEKEELIWTNPPEWMRDCNVKFYYLVDIADEVLLTYGDETLRDWALRKWTRENAV